MSKKDDNPYDRPFDLEVAHAAVRLDVAGVLGAFLDGELRPDQSIGEATWRSGNSEFFAVRWRFDGRHTGRIPGFGHTFIEATGNSVSVPGFTLVENTVPGQPVPGDLDDLLRSGTVRFQRFIDWLAVFAQIGVLHLGRPMSITDIDFGPAHRGTRRLAGYNDQQ
jgi:hypothetical protein